MFAQSLRVAERLICLSVFLGTLLTAGCIAPTPDVEEVSITAIPSPTESVRSPTELPTAVSQPALTDTPIPPTATNQSPSTTPVSPSATPTPKNTTASTSDAGHIRGLTATAVDAYFRQNGLQMVEYQEFKDEGTHRWIYELNLGGANLWVVLLGHTSTSVEHITAAITQSGTPDDKVAISLLNIVAAVPYFGAEPEKAVAWVESELPTVSFGTGAHIGVTSFGKVQFTLFGLPELRNLGLGRWP